jgi:hypothetical protein
MEARVRSALVTETYNTVPTVARSEYKTDKPLMRTDFMTLTWDDGENRMMRTVYHPLPVHAVFKDEKKEELVPVFVRVSMKDSLGLVSVDMADKRRTSGFCADCSYKFIER